MISGVATHTNFMVHVVFGFTQPRLVPTSTVLDASTLIITPPMQSGNKGKYCIALNNDYVSEWRDMSIYADHCYSCDTMNTQFNVLICVFKILDTFVLVSSD